MEGLVPEGPGHHRGPGWRGRGGRCLPAGPRPGKATVDPLPPPGRRGRGARRTGLRPRGRAVVAGARPPGATDLDADQPRERRRVPASWAGDLVLADQMDERVGLRSLPDHDRWALGPSQLHPGLHDQRHDRGPLGRYRARVQHPRTRRPRRSVPERQPSGRVPLRHRWTRAHGGLGTGPHRRLAGLVGCREPGHPGRHPRQRRGRGAPTTSTSSPPGPTARV